MRRDLLVGEAPREVADLALLVGQLVQAHRLRTATVRAPVPTSAARATAAGGLQAPAELLEAHDLPALLARDAPQLGVGVDRHRVPDGAQHRQVGLRVGVGVGGGQVDALGRRQLAHRHRLALAVGEGPRGAPGVVRRRRPPSARPARRRSSARGRASRPSPARRPCRCRPGAPRPGGRGRPRASAGTGAAARRPAPWARGAAGRPRAGRRSSRRPRGARGRSPGRSSRAGGTSRSPSRSARSAGA